MSAHQNVRRSGSIGRIRDELLNDEIFYTLAEARVVVKSWKRFFYTLRPHGSLGYRTPAPEVFIPQSARSAALPRPASPPALAHNPIMNQHSNWITCWGSIIFSSTFLCLRGQTIFHSLFHSRRSRHFYQLCCVYHATLARHVMTAHTQRPTGTATLRHAAGRRLAHREARNEGRLLPPPVLETTRRPLPRGGVLGDCPDGSDSLSHPAFTSAGKRRMLLIP